MKSGVTASDKSWAWRPGNEARVSSDQAVIGWASCIASHAMIWLRGTNSYMVLVFTLSCKEHSCSPKRMVLLAIDIVWQSGCSMAYTALHEPERFSPSWG